MSESESIELHVQRLRAAVLARHGLNPGDAMPEKLTKTAVDEVQRYAMVSAHWGIASELPVVGGLLVMFRRALRILLRWYINPIVEQQNLFNQATVRALWELQLENESLRADLNRRFESSDLARS
jgi:hypothetical protein